MIHFFDVKMQLLKHFYINYKVGLYMSQESRNLRLCLGPDEPAVLESATQKAISQLGNMQI